MSGLPPAGWFPDPLRRYEERYWDGSTWTSRVRRGGREGVDVPYADAPAGGESQASSGSQEPARDGRLATVVGEPSKPALERRLKRPRPSGRLSESMAVAGGALGAVGLFGLFGESDSKAVLLVASAVVLAASYVVALLGPELGRSAALAGAVVGPAAFVIGAFEGVLEGRWSVVVPAFVLGAVWLAMFVGPGVRGAPILMAGVLLAGWAVLLGLTMDTAEQTSLTLELDDGTTSAPLVAEEDPFADPAGSTLDVAEDSGIVTLVYALGVVVAAAVLDRRGWHALATPFLGVTVVLAVFGLSMTLTGADATGAAALVVLVGGVIAAIGGMGRRRGSIWIGTGLAAVGLFALVAEQVTNPQGLGVALLLVAAALVLAARPVDAMLGGPGDGDGAATPEA